jgi:hypothetical protein
MAIYFETKTPNKLLKTFKKAIDDGHVVTWSCDGDGDFTHTPDQWAHQAWLRPAVTTGKQLSFSILAPTDSKVSSEAYAVYHGRFIESMLAHCDTLFTDARATAMPAGDDKVE